jgi:predicted nucleic acid-binding Zn ribbon protein
MRRNPGSTTAEALQGVFTGMEGGGRLRENLALAYWDRVVGPQAAAASEADSVFNGTLTVRTKSSVWSHELTFMQDHIRKELNRLIGRAVIQRIVFKAQGVARPEPEPGPGGLPSDEELEMVVLTAKDNASLQKELAELDTVSDRKVVEIVSRRLVREKKLFRWRLEHGWKMCGRCGTAFISDGGVCGWCGVGV